MGIQLLGLCIGQPTFTFFLKEQLRLLNHAIGQTKLNNVKGRWAACPKIQNFFVRSPHLCLL